MRRVLGVVLAMALAACANPGDVSGDIAVGLDEGAACPDPSSYCATLGYYFTGCGREGAGSTCHAWGDGGAYLETQTSGSYYAKLTRYFDWAYCPTHGTYNCPTFNWYYSYDESQTDTSVKKCKGYTNCYQWDTWYYYEHHIVGNPTSNCFAYLECVS